MKKFAMFLVIFMMTLSFGNLALADGAYMIFNQSGDNDPFSGWDGDGPFSQTRVAVEYGADPLQVLAEGVYETDFDNMRVMSIDANNHTTTFDILPYDIDLGRYHWESPELNEYTGEFYAAAFISNSNNGVDVHTIIQGAGDWNNDPSSQRWEEISNQLQAAVNPDLGQLNNRTWVQTITGFGSNGQFEVPYLANGTPPDYLDSHVINTYQDIANLSITTSLFEGGGLKLDCMDKQILTSEPLGPVMAFMTISRKLGWVGQIPRPS